MNTVTQETKIPFTGFYDSIHSMNIDQAIDSDIEDLTIEDQQQVHSDFSYTKKLLEGYSKLYVETIANTLGIGLKFKALESPREYNFSTDRIFADISEKDILKLYTLADKDDLKELVKKQFTSFDGFASHYSNDLNDWDQDVLEWDRNQLGCLIETVLNAEDFEEIYAMDDANYNGEISDLVWSAYSEENKKLIEARNEA